MPQKITASFEFNDQAMTGVDVVNPGDGSGKTFLLAFGGGSTPLLLIVEADMESGAIEALAESEEYSHHIVVDESDLDDYDPESCEYSASGKVIDTDRLSLPGCAVQITCRYHGDGLPVEGVDPTQLCGNEIAHEDE